MSIKSMEGQSKNLNNKKKYPRIIFYSRVEHTRLGWKIYIFVTEKKKKRSGDGKYLYFFFTQCKNVSRDTRIIFFFFILYE